MTDQPPAQIERLSKEPGFVSFDLFRPPYTYKIPVSSPGILAFLREEDGAESVLRLMLADDLARGFARSRPFCGHANFAAYRAFRKSADFEQHKQDLAEQLKLYAQLTEKYRVPQTVWPIEYF